MASEDGYSMTVVMQEIDGGKVTTLFYRLNDTNNLIDPIIEGWTTAGYDILSIGFVRGGR